MRYHDARMASPTAIAREIRRLLKERGDEKTICPSEVARSLAPEGWRPLMQKVRDVAAKLAAKGEVVITQRGRRVDPERARGPIRIASRPPE